MILFPLLFPLTIVLSHPISHDCDGFFSYQKHCDKLILELIQDWSFHKPIPSVTLSKSLYSDCQKALDCTKLIDCPEKDKEISKKLADLGEMCSGIKAFSSAFGLCTEIIRSKESSRDYPCLKYWDNLEQSPTCEFFESDYDCAQMLVENQCGIGALGEMDKNKKFISEHFGCNPSSSSSNSSSIWDGKRMPTGKVYMN